MNNLKKMFCSMFALAMLPLTACTPSNVEEYRLNIKDSNDIILNINKLTEPNKNYGLYKKGEEITFEILFFSGVSATL